MDGVTLRHAGTSDGPFLLYLANDPRVRAASFDRAVICDSDHQSWLRDVLSDSTRSLFVVERHGVPCGMVRIDKIAQRRFELSIALDANVRGFGLGPCAVQLAMDWLDAHSPGSKLDASVMKGNQPSIRLFRGCGFTTIDDTQSIASESLTFRIQL